MKFHGRCYLILCLWIKVVNVLLADNTIHFCPFEDIVLDCGYTSTMKLLSVIWYVNDEAVSSYTAIRSNILEDNYETMFEIQNGTFSLKVYNISKSEKYKCTVIDEGINKETIMWTTKPYDQPHLTGDCNKNVCVIDKIPDPLQLACSASNLTQEEDARIYWKLADDLKKNVTTFYKANVLTSAIYAINEENAEQVSLHRKRIATCTLFGPATCGRNNSVTYEAAVVEGYNKSENRLKYTLIVIGCIFFMVILFTVLVRCFIKRKKNRQSEPTISL